MDERLKIIVESDGTFTIKRQLLEIGKEGDKAARLVQNSFKAAMDQLRWQTKVAMNSTRLAEKARVDAARAAAQEVARLRRSEAKAAQDAARASVAAARQASRLEVEQARARRRAELSERRKIADAKRDATFGLGTHFSAVAGVLGLGSAISNFVQYSDAATEVSNRIKLVTSSEAELTKLTERLRETALGSRTEFDLTTRTYARLARSTSQLNLSQGANVAMTETLTKAIAVSGATGAEAHATLIQLSQAMASNRLSADEFRSVSEQLPIILDLLATSTGHAKTELKDMGQEGKLTSRVMALAFLEGLDTIREQFDKTVPTIEQAWENVKTQTRFAVQEFNNSTGASKKVTEALQWMAKNMDIVTAAAKALGSMIGVYLITQVGLAAKALVTLAATNPWIAAATGLAALIALVIQYKEELTGLPKKQRNFAEVTAESIRTGKSIPDVLADMDERDRLLGEDVTSSKHAVDTENTELDRRFAIANLKSQSDPPSKKKKRGRHVPTFAEAVDNLQDEAMAMRINKNEREQLNAVMKISEQIQRQLTAGETAYVRSLVRTKDFFSQLEKAKEDSAEAAKKRYDQETKNILELKKAQEESRIEAAKLYKESLRLENRIYGEKFGTFNSEEEIRAGRRKVKDMVLGGRLSKDKGQRALDFLEMHDPNTKEARKDWLAESLGVGKLAQQIDGIFGPEGTLSSGIANATANAIVFHQSFSKAMHSLGQQIQAEVISALIQAGIRMAILGAQGGASPSIGAVGAPNSNGGYIFARGRGYANGGYTGDGGRTRIAGYVHGGEGVIKANSMQTIGRPALDYMNKTGQIPGGGGAVNLKIINNSGVRLEAQQGMSRDEVVLVAREEASKQTDRTVAGRLRDPNSYTSKALRGNTNMRVQR